MMRYDNYTVFVIKDEVLTPDKIEECKKIWDEEYKKKWKIYGEYHIVRKSILDNIKTLWGENSRQFKYFDKEIVPSPQTTNHLVDTLKNRLENLKKKDAIQKFEIEKNNILQEACVYLQDKGKILGKDFTFENAIDNANEIAFDLAKKKYIGKDEFISFGGNDNCENCGGWNGESNRCECGNRRVGWEYDGNFKNPIVYAQAY